MIVDQTFDRLERACLENCRCLCYRNQRVELDDRCSHCRRLIDHLVTLEDHDNVVMLFVDDIE